MEGISLSPHYQAVLSNFMSLKQLRSVVKIWGKVSRINAMISAI